MFKLMAYTDETIYPFSKDQFKGMKLSDIPDWYFKSYWKHNDSWYRANTSSKGGNPFTYATNSYSHQRWEMMEYIEENFEPEEL